MNVTHLKSETFSSVDAVWLHIDTPTNLATITGVLTFDEHLDYERLQLVLERRFLIHRRFRQRVREPELPWGLPRWETYPDFDIHEHLLRTSLPELADHSALQELVGHLMSEPLDESRPLWQFYLVENYLQGSALICRLHHCIADGLALVQVLLAITDEEPDSRLPEAVKQSQGEGSELSSRLSPEAKVWKGSQRACRLGRKMVHEGTKTLVNPRHMLEAARFGRNAALALGKLLLIGPDRKTALRGQCDIAKRVAWSAVVKLEDVKAIGRLMGGTANDTLLSAVTGALRRYLEERGEDTAGLDIRVMVPVNLRAPDAIDLMGNRFGLVFLSLPVGIRDPIKRLVVLRRRMEAIKNSPEAVVAFSVLGMIGLTPTQIENIIAEIFGMKGTGVITNVPGPGQPLYLAGQKIVGLMFWVPMPANLGLGVSIVSYAGEVVLGVATDAKIVPDPEIIPENFLDELNFLGRWGRPQKIEVKS